MIETIRKCDICGYEIWRKKCYHVKGKYGNWIDKLDICEDCWGNMRAYIKDKRKKESKNE